ncbi:MAG: hypothetical protein MUF78_00255 [Candidatus Edwardsbacteria bacterium]|jgi:hypothetical protein|nr:hypothetical protein [Candidatus Edwardsbacteria bacterium]
MSTDAIIDLTALWRAARRGWPAGLAGAVIFGGAALLADLRAPLLYRCQSLVELPAAWRWPAADSAGCDAPLFTVSETRLLLARFPSGALAPGDPLLPLCHSVSLSQVGAAESWFRLTVISRDDPSAAAALSAKALDHLRDLPAVRDRVAVARAEAEARQRDLEQAVERVVRAPRRSASDVVAAEAGLVALQAELRRARSSLEHLGGYHFVGDPVTDPVPVAPQRGVHAAASAILGLLAGIVGAALLRAARGRTAHTQR